MFFPARIQNSRGAIVSYRISTYLVGGIFENINVIFFGKFPLNLTLDFLNLTKCNFRRHFGGCLVKKHGIVMCLECFLIALPQQRHLNKWNSVFTNRLVKNPGFLWFLGLESRGQTVQNKNMGKMNET